MDVAREADTAFNWNYLVRFFFSLQSRQGLNVLQTETDSG